MLTEIFAWAIVFMVFFIWRFFCIYSESYCETPHQIHEKPKNHKFRRVVGKALKTLDEVEGISREIDGNHKLIKKLLNVLGKLDEHAKACM